MLSLSSQAAWMTCTATEEDHDDYLNNQLGVFENFRGECNSHRLDGDEINGWRTERLAFKLKGVGLGLHFGQEAFTLICPNALGKNIAKNPFYGVKAKAAMGPGVDAAVFSNKKGGICFLVGIQFGFGAGISGAELEFRKINY